MWISTFCIAIYNDTAIVELQKHDDDVVYVQVVVEVRQEVATKETT